MADSTTWYPLKVFTSIPSDDTKDHHAIIILNCGASLKGLDKVICDKWKSFGMHVCADGGANSLYDSLEQYPECRECMIPEVIIGDMDSIRSDVLDYYKQKGSKTISDTDQCKTDFTKSIEHIQSLKQYTVVHAINTMWGRMDQLMGNTCTLFCFADLQLYLLSETSVSFGLQKGSHVIKVDTGLEEDHCGFFPFCGPCKSCTTTGCKWNLDDQCMEMTGLVSSCNLIDGKEITLSCSDPVLFTLSHKLC